MRVLTEAPLFRVVSIKRCGASLVRALLLTFSLVALVSMLFVPNLLALLRLVLFLEDNIVAPVLICVIPNGFLFVGIDVVVLRDLLQICFLRKSLT